MPKALFFGATRDIIGNSQLNLDVAGKTVGETKKLLVERFPELGELAHVAVALNEQYAQDGETISDSDVIAIIPPVSGG